MNKNQIVSRAIALGTLLKNLNQGLIRNFRESFYSGQFIMLSPRRQGRKEKRGRFICLYNL